VAAGKRAYDASCAVCHGSTMMNGTFGTPLAGEYLRKKWLGRTVAAFFAKSKTMPPAAPASLSDKEYAAIVAYILEVNGIPPGETELPSNGAMLRGMRIKLPSPAHGAQ
jgi:mono/diheme cytochrome c family protein